MSNPLAVNWDIELALAQTHLSQTRVMCYLCGEPSVQPCGCCGLAVCAAHHHSVYEDSGESYSETHFCPGCFSRHGRESDPPPGPVWQPLGGLPPYYLRGHSP